MKLLLGVSLILILFPSCAYAEEMIFVGYEEVADCKYPSVTECVTEDDGQKHCKVKQDERCEDGR